MQPEMQRHCRLGQQFIPQIDVRHGHAVQQVADHVEVEDAEDHGTFDGRGRVHSASAAGCEFLYLLALLDRLGFKQKKPTPIYEDTTACIEWINNVISGLERAKHIDIRKHFAHCCDMSCDCLSKYHG